MNTKTMAQKIEALPKDLLGATFYVLDDLGMSKQDFFDYINRKEGTNHRWSQATWHWKHRDHIPDKFQFHMRFFVMLWLFYDLKDKKKLADRLAKVLQPRAK